MLMWLREERPCWYELDWRTDGKPAIVFRIHPKAFAETDFERSHLVHDLTKRLDLGEFANGEAGNFGFGSSCDRSEGEDGFVEISARLPYLKKPRKCLICDGRGKDPFEPEDDCLFCNGTGKEYAVEHQKSLVISATFSIITAVLSVPIETDCDRKQLLTVRTLTETRIQGGSLSGEISPALARWLDSRPDIPALAVEAMTEAWRKMMGELRLGEFRTHLNQGGRIHLSCPGEACGIDPELRSSTEWGYEFSPHNVDNALQQLALLAGLAAIHGEARRNGT